MIINARGEVKGFFSRDVHFNPEDFLHCETIDELTLKIREIIENTASIYINVDYWDFEINNSHFTEFVMEWQKLKKEQE